MIRQRRRKRLPWILKDAALRAVSTGRTQSLTGHDGTFSKNPGASASPPARSNRPSWRAISVSSQQFTTTNGGIAWFVDIGRITSLSVTGVLPIEVDCTDRSGSTITNRFAYSTSFNVSQAGSPCTFASRVPACANRVAVTPDLNCTPAAPPG